MLEEKKFPVPFAGILWLVAENGSYFKPLQRALLCYSPQKQKFPVFSLLIRELALRGLPVDCTHYHFSSFSTKVK